MVDAVVTKATFSTTLNTAVAVNGTFTLPYPSGLSYDTFGSALRNAYLITNSNNRFNLSDGRIAVSFGVAYVTVTNLTGSTLAVGTLCQLYAEADPTANKAKVDLAGLGRPANRRIAVFGDSRTANGILVSGSSNQFYARGLLAWARVLSKQAFDHATSDVIGTPGFTSAQVLASLVTALPTTVAGTILVLCGTNDRAPVGIPAANTIATMQAIQNLVQSYGKILIWLNEMPRGGANVLAGADLQAHLSVNAWLNAQAQVPGVYVANSFGRMVDPTSTSASPRSALFADGLHPDANGAYFGPGLALLPIINNLFHVRPFLAPGVADVYDATNNPRGVLNANPMFTGTGGTKNVGAGTAFTGNLGDNYSSTIGNGAGVTVVASKVTTTTFSSIAYTDDTTKDWQQLVISGTPSSAGASVNVVPASSVAGNLAIGDVLDLTLEFEVDAGQTGLNGLQFEGIGTSFNRRDMTASTAVETYPNTALAGIMRVGPFVVTSAETSFFKPQITISLLQSVAVSATIRFRALAARKVI